MSTSFAINLLPQHSLSSGNYFPTNRGHGDFPKFPHFRTSPINNPLPQHQQRLNKTCALQFDFSSLIAPTRASVSSQKIVHHEVGAYVQHFFESYDVVLPHENGVQQVTLGIFGAGASVENCAGVILSLSCHYVGRPSQMPTLMV